MRDDPARTHRISTDAEHLLWLLSRFLSRIAAISKGAAISADGRLMATSAGVALARADRLATVASAVAILALGGAEDTDLGHVGLVVWEFDRGPSWSSR